MTAVPACKRWVIYALTGVLLLCLLPTVTWFDFDESMEGVVAASALESKREGHYAIPILNTRPRVRKPPLATWIAMAGIRSETIDQLSEPDHEKRLASFRDLSWQIRWTGVVTACLLALGAAELARLIGGNALAVKTLLVTASCGLFLRHSRIASFDTQLAMWVTWTNVLLLRGMLTRRWWPHFTLAGLTLGLAFMSKGPIALIQSVVPMALAAFWLKGNLPKQAADDRRQTNYVIPAIVGLLIAICVPLPWVLWIIKTVPDAYSVWVAESLRGQGAAHSYDPFTEYLKIIKLLLPWSLFFVFGVISGVIQAWRDRRSMIAIPVLLTIVPILIMSFFPEKNDRYLLPMVSAACILTARAVLDISLAFIERKANLGLKVLLLLHVLLLGMFAVRWSLVGGWARVVNDQLQLFGRALPIDRKAVLDMTEGWPTFPAGIALITLVLLFGTWLAGIVLHRRWIWALAVMTAIVSIGSDSLKLYGQSPERSSVTDMAHALADTYPRLPVYSINTSPPSDLLIYTNRGAIRVGDWSEIPRGGPKLVLTQRHKKKEELPPPPRADAKHVDHKRRMNQYWDAWWLPE